MKNRWLQQFVGFVEVRVSGVGADRFVNYLVRDGIFVKQMRRLNEAQIVFQIKVQDVQKLRQHARGKRLKFHFTKRIGFPFVLQRWRLNSGLIAGVLLFAVLIFVLSNIVWKIQIDGASVKTEHLIRRELDKLDVKVGQFSFSEGNVDEVQKRVTNKVPSVTWVGVEVRGSVYHLQVVEKKQPMQLIDESYSQLVSGKKAYIVSTFVETGQVLVEKRQLVEKGDVLVSGSIGKDDKLIYVGAKGIVKGETWYQTTSEVPFHSTFSRLTGDTKTKTALTIFGFKVPVWGFFTPRYQTAKIDREQTDFHFWKWRLPIGLAKTRIQETKETNRHLTVDAATKIAKENARTDLQKQLPSDAKVIKENLLQKQVSNDKVRIKVHYEVIENIAVGDDQGDLFGE